VAKKKTDSAFDIKDSEFKGRWEDREAFVTWICNELDLATSGRSWAASEIKYSWDYYEQARMRGSNSPWPDAADLPSPFAPEYTDAVHARLLQTIFVEPVWTVEGWGPSASRAPFVEEFHQRAQEDERLQNFADEWLLRGLVEGVGTLEVSEAFELRREVQRKRVQLAIDETSGLPVMGEDNEAVLARDPETQDYLDAEDETQPSAEVDVDTWQPTRLGPEYDVIPYLDFLTLPAHARNRQQVWGYAKRFWKRVPELEYCAKRGIYDTTAVEEAGDDNDRAALSDEAPAGQTPVSQDGPTAQKELYEVQVLADLDGEGERWWRVTVHKDRRKLLRLKHDDRTTRYIRWFPFPKPGNVDRGYSLIGHKLITVLEEDTARRNMKADRMAFKIGQPVLRQVGALWEPYEQPMGPRAVIDVRNKDEISLLQGIEDVPQSVMAWGPEIRGDADRLIGQNDTALGVDTQESRTLGEVQLRAGYAEVRINVIVKRMQESLEELGQARHTIWKRTLAANPNLPLQRAMVIGRQAAGIDVNAFPDDGRVTAQLLEGTFWFKPRGSVETADLNRQKADTVALLQVLPGLMQLNPAIGMIFQTMPAAKALVENVLRVFRWPDPQSFLGSEADNVFQVMQQQQEQQMQQQQAMQDPRMQVLMALSGAAPGPAGGMMGAPDEAAGPPTGGMVQ
jgi:hypothetical protein